MSTEQIVIVVLVSVVCYLLGWLVMYRGHKLLRRRRMERGIDKRSGVDRRSTKRPGADRRG